MAGLLVGHEFDQAASFRSESGRLEFRVCETSQAIMKKVELDPLRLSQYLPSIWYARLEETNLLVQSECNGFKVEVRFHHVSRLRAIST